MDAKTERQAASERWDVEPVMTVEHLTMRFGGLIAINDLSFNVGRGDITALIGPNGAGKTTVFNCVTGFYKPTEGRVIMRHGHAGVAIEQTSAEITHSGAQWAATGLWRSTARATGARRRAPGSALPGCRAGRS